MANDLTEYWNVVNIQRTAIQQPQHSNSLLQTSIRDPSLRSLPNHSAPIPHFFSFLASFYDEIYFVKQCYCKY